MDIELKTVRALLLFDLADIAEQHLNVLRNHGIAARGQLVESFEDFEVNVEKKTWDLVLLKDGIEEYQVSKVSAVIEKFVKDLPIIGVLDVLDSRKEFEYLSAGAKAVISESYQGHMVLMINRELENLNVRRERRALSMALSESEKRCNQLIKSSRDAVAYIAAGMHVYANERYLMLFGFDTFDELEGVPILDLVASSHQSEMKAFMKQYSVGLGVENSIATLISLENGSQHEVMMHFSQATYDGEICIQLLVRTNEEDSDLQNQLEKVSHQDILTGLYNRQYLMDKLQDTIVRSQDEGGNAAYLAIRVQRYQQMQNELGIANCDLLVNDVATELQKMVPDESLLGHFNDDTFAIILNRMGRSQVEEFISQLLQFFKTYLAEVQGRTVPVDFAIGVVLLNDSSDNPQKVVMQAHAAIDEVQSKPDTENKVVFYTRKSEDIDVSSVDIGISEQLQSAIEKGLFKVLFQPIISLRAQNQPFYEVFLRMLSPEGDEVSPDKFIETAANSKVAEKIDRWVVVQSIKSLAREYQEGRPTRLIINITPQTLMDDSFVPWLGMALKASRLPHDALVFQIPEHEVYRYLKEAKATCSALTDLHCKVSFSRFGGMSNPFSLLRHVHVDYVKLDGSYTTGLVNDNGEQFQELVEQAHAMGKITIATYVEEVKVLTALYGLGVHYIQGYYLQSPSPVMDYDFSGDEDDESGADEVISY